MSQPVVAVCADKNIEIGLHVTLYSLLASTPSPVKIYFVQKGYAGSDIERLSATLKPFSGRYTLVVVPFDDRIFKGLRGLHGNRMPYAKLVLADLVQEDRIVFLDSDLAVLLDICELFEEDLNGFLIGAAGGGKFGWCLERDFFESLGFDMEAPYFSSGVMLLDLAGWRNAKVSEKCWEVARRYAPQLRNTDQQVLNTVFCNKFRILPTRYNHVLWPSSDRVDESSRDILHFGGMPKPWDLFGEALNRNSHVYLSILENTYFKGWRSWKSLRVSTVSRFLRAPRSYYQLLRAL